MALNHPESGGLLLEAVVAMSILCLFVLSCNSAYVAVLATHHDSAARAQLALSQASIERALRGGVGGATCVIEPESGGASGRLLVLTGVDCPTGTALSPEAARFFEICLAGSALRVRSGVGRPGAACLEGDAAALGGERVSVGGQFHRPSDNTVVARLRFTVPGPNGAPAMEESWSSTFTFVGR